MTTIDLTARVCRPCEGGVDPMTRDQIDAVLPQVAGWALADGHLERSFRFDNYYKTISFVNAVAWVANKENHHPVMEVGFRQCTVRLWTHAIDGLSENDFICAAKISLLVERGE